MKILLVILTLFMMFQLLVTVLKMELSTGLLETVGVNTGVNKVSSELLEEQITLLLRLIAPGLFPKIHGQTNRFITPLKLRKMIQTMMLSQ
jgi:hypothetical protein